MRTSVIIPTFNRPRGLEACLDALAEQTVLSGSFDVVVVDDGSETPLALDPGRWAAKFDLTLLRQHNTGPAAARNRGVAESCGELLAFTDDDCLPAPTWLEKLVAAVREHPEALVGGSTVNGLKDDLFAETSQLIVEMVYQHFNRDPADAYFLASNNMGCHRKAFLAVGGFDRRFRAAAEDREFCDRWRMAGRRLWWIRDAVIEHRHAQSLRSFTQLHLRYGQGAYHYQRLRKSRGSGSMREDLGFHGSLPRSVWGALSDRSPGRRLQLVSTLMLWQVANALGFFWAAGRELLSRR
ncbi:MAG: glycosyltransferase family 2 protein [Planctomycetaceae bacterium]